MNPDTAELARAGAAEVAPPGRGSLPAWGAPKGRPARDLTRTWPGRSAHSLALGDACQALFGSRALVWLAGVGSVLAFGFGPPRKVLQHAQLTRGFGSLGDVLVAPAARWDAAWYLLIARAGYNPSLGSATLARSAFFPLYPLALRAFSLVLLPPVLAGILVSVAALAMALYGLHRLTALEIGAGSFVPRSRAGRTRAAIESAGEPPDERRDNAREVARLAVLVVAFSPMAFFFSAIYSESLYLALSVGVFWFARQGRWAACGLLGALAGATRPTGVLLLAPALILYLYGPRADREPDSTSWSFVPSTLLGSWATRRRAARAPVRLAARVRIPGPRYRARKDVLWLALMPAGVLLFMAYLGLAGGDPMSPFSAQQFWGRALAGPFVGLWDGAVAAFDSVRQLLSFQAHHSYIPQAVGNPLVSASHDLPLFLFAIGAVAVCIGVLRTMPFAYGAYVALALALPLSYPVSSEPLMSLPRFILVLFPLAMWLAYWLARHPRARAPILLGSALSMVFFTGAFATWHWVS